MKPFKVTCPECEEYFLIDQNKYDEGDLTECPECGATLLVEVKYGRIVLKSDNAKYYDEDILCEFAEEEE